MALLLLFMWFCFWEGRSGSRAICVLLWPASHTASFQRDEARTDKLTNLSKQASERGLAEEIALHFAYSSPYHTRPHYLIVSSCFRASIVTLPYDLTISSYLTFESSDLDLFGSFI